MEILSKVGSWEKHSRPQADVGGAKAELGGSPLAQTKSPPNLGCLATLHSFLPPVRPRLHGYMHAPSVPEAPPFARGSVGDPLGTICTPKGGGTSGQALGGTSRFPVRVSEPRRG